MAQEINDAAGGEKPEGMSTRQASAGAIAYQGMTMEELADIVEKFNICRIHYKLDRGRGLQ